MATSGRRAQEAIRAHGSNKCSKHFGQEVIYFCENCEDLVCADCVIQQHKGHELEGLRNVIPGAKQKLQDFIHRAEATDIPRIIEKIKNADSDLSKNKKHFQNQVSQIKRRNETLKNELDKITNTMVKTCHDMENQNSDTLLNHQKELQTQLDKLSSKIQEVKATLQSGNDVLMYDTSSVIPEFEDIPTPLCNTAEFRPGKLLLQQLEQLLGELNITDHYQPSLSLSQPANWRVMSEFTPFEGHYAKSMHAEGDKTWLSFYSLTSGNGKKLLLVNQKGQVQQTLNMDADVRDFYISPQTGNIWFCSGADNGIREVKDSKSQVKFTADSKPMCICVTRDGHILVGNDYQILKYTQTGKNICKTGETLEGTKPAIWTTFHISECPLTRHVAVVNRDWKSRGGNGKPFVSILNDQLQLLHIYRGEMSGQQPPPRPFDPFDVCYTDTGELVIVDRDNKSVLLVTGKGKHLQTMYIDSKSGPVAVSVYRSALLVSLVNGKVKVLENK